MESWTICDVVLYLNRFHLNVQSWVKYHFNIPPQNLFHFWTLGPCVLYKRLTYTTQDAYENVIHCTDYVDDIEVGGLCVVERKEMATFPWSTSATRSRLGGLGPVAKVSDESLYCSGHSPARTTGWPSSHTEVPLETGHGSPHFLKSHGFRLGWGISLWGKRKADLDPPLSVYAEIEI